MPEVTGNEFLDKLLEQAPATATLPHRGQNYNYPYRWYLKPDGTVVELQGDPQNRAYYQDKGFHMLSDVPTRSGPSELRQWLDVERPKLLKEQQEKARIINAIRKMADKRPELNLDDTYDTESVEEMREELVRIKELYGVDIKLTQTRRQAAREERDARLAGVETSDNQSLESLQAKLNGDEPPRGRKRP